MNETNHRLHVSLVPIEIRLGKLLIVSKADARTGTLSGGPKSAICVQGFDDSQNSAIHMTYHILLCPSSIGEPRYPMLKVVFNHFFLKKERERERHDGLFSIYRSISFDSLTTKSKEEKGAKLRLSL